MRKFYQKLSAVFFTIVMVVGLAGTISVYRVQAADHTQEEAVRWALEQSESRKSLDYDGLYGAQCVDLIAYYYQYLGTQTPGGNAIDYANNKLPDGWRRETSDYQPGDIAVWYANFNGTTVTGPNGHVAIITSIEEQYIYVVDQNGYDNKGYCAVHKYSMDGIQCVIRPDFSSSGDSTDNLVNNSYIFTSVRAENVTASSAKIIANYANNVYGDVGFYFGTSSDLAAMTKVSEYKYSSIAMVTSSNNSYQVGAYYDDTYGYKWWPALKPGTTYYYAFYCTQNGVEHISSIQSFTTVGGESAFPLLDGEIYKICSVLSGQALEVSDGKSANGQRITLWPYGGAPWMQWKAVRHSDGYSFLNVATGKALDISGGSAVEKAVLQQWDYAAVDAQRFRLVDQGNGRYGMFARCSGLAVDVVGSVTSPGATMAQYAFHGRDNQLWYFELIDTTAPVISNIRVTDVDSTGYTILCDVTDNAGVARVAFPTWTDSNGQDDIAQDWYDSCALFQPINGNTYAFRVNRVEHNNEYGSYTTHIYAYDSAGNLSCDGCNVTLQLASASATSIGEALNQVVQGIGQTLK